MTRSSDAKRFGPRCSSRTVRRRMQGVCLAFLMIVVTTLGLGMTTAHAARCPPCPPPPPPQSRRDNVLPSKPHYPCKKSHAHHYTFHYNQDQRTCRCFVAKKERVECH
jgi:hypothetical protein